MQNPEDYPFVILVMDAGFAACAVISRSFRRWQNRRLLAALNSHQLRDIGLTPSDIWSGRLGEILAMQEKAAAASDGRPEPHPRSLNKEDACRRALAELREDQLCNLSEAGLKARREERRQRSAA